MREKSECRSKTAHPSKTAAWGDMQRKDDEAIDEILFLFRKFMVSFKNDLNVLPLKTAISRLQVAMNRSYSQEELSVLQHHLRKALLTRYSVFGWIDDLEACFVSHSEGIAIVVAKGSKSRDIEKVEGIQTAIQVIDECRQSIDTASLDDIIEVAMESIKLYTKGKQALQKAELLCLLGNAIGMRYLGGVGERDLKSFNGAKRLREAEYVCRGDFPLTYICLAALTHVGWLQATECRRGEEANDVRGHTGKAQPIGNEGAKSVEIGTKMAEEAVGISQLQEAITHLRSSLHCRMLDNPQRLSMVNELANALEEKYSLGDSLEDLEECILLRKEGLRLLSTHESHRAMWLNNLANNLHVRFQRKGAFQDLEECILLHRETLHLLPHSDPNRSGSLNDLAGALSTRFEQKGAIQDLEECILRHREALNLRPHPHPLRSGSLNNLGGALWTYFQRKGAMQDLDECILLHREALDLRPHSHPHRSSSLYNLAGALLTRFQQKVSMQDLEECILLYREALHLRPHPHPNRSSSLNNLADALSTRFKQKKAMQDLDECILLRREALDLLSHPHPLRSSSLNNLAGDLSTRFEQKGAMQDLEQCVLLLREVLHFLPQSHPDRSGFLGNLGVALWTCFQQKGGMQDLEECILLHREALDLRPHPHPLRSSSLNDLANALSIRFEQKGEMQNLEECILLLREALHLLPHSHLDRSGLLDNLGGALWTCFMQKGAMQYLEECILLHREALDLRPHCHPDRWRSHNNLANALSIRFKQKGAMQDLEECILLHREALHLLPNSHPDRSGSLNNLAGALSTRFERRRAMQDLEQCIRLLREALDLRPHPHPHRSGSLNDLADALRTRFERKGATEDLDECILLHREALDLRPHPHTDRSGSLNNLAHALSTRFKLMRVPEDFEEALQLYHTALGLCCPPNPNRLDSLHNLADLHTHRYSHKKDVADLEQALIYFELASHYETGSMLRRLNSIKTCVAIARMHRPTASLDAYLYALELLPQLASIDLTLKQRQDVLEHSRELVGNAAQCAISQNQLETAVVFLSTGRSVFWSQALQLRTPVDGLAAVNPSLAETYLDTTKRLEQASHDSTYHSHTSLASDRHTSNQPSTFISLSTLVDCRRQAIEDIRKIPGFEAFLLPPSFLSLKHAARNGPVILLNASEFGCDALIMRESGAVDHIALADINLEHLEALKLLVHKSLAGRWRSSDGTQPEVQPANDVLQTLLPRDFVSETEGFQPVLSSKDRDPLQSVLNILWDNVVRHVVEALALHKTSSPKRIWWCPTGLFASLPIHAAGRYSDNDEPIDCLFHYAVSSYCTSPQDLLHQTRISPEYRMAAIIEPEAPGGNPLPFALTELEKIMGRIPSSQWQQLIIRLGLKDAPNQIEDVLPDIQQSSIVHFGCHGNQNLYDPLESYLLLTGGRLTISRIIKECQVSSSASLAYLSACETAKGDEDRLDESLNLVASIMFAGFRSVVGTMWSIFDCDAPIVADVFYGHLFRNGKDGLVDLTDASYGLHLATRHLRELGRGFRSWVPYVHYGI